MIDKNQFLIYNEIIYSLNQCQDFDDLKNLFFPKLKMLIPFSYASILLYQIDEKTAEVSFRPPICFPDYFTEAEEAYIAHFDQDNLLWLMHRKESTLIRESDLLDNEKRINSYMYQHCYSRYDIFDTLQYSLTYKGTILGALTLFHTRIDGVFSDVDMFYLRSCGIHLNLLIYHLFNSTKSDCPANCSANTSNSKALQDRYALTNRETELLSLIYRYYNIDEMARELRITEHTVQKHLQNLFRKMNVSSRWELLKKSVGQTDF